MGFTAIPNNAPVLCGPKPDALPFHSVLILTVQDSVPQDCPTLDTNHKFGVSPTLSDGLYNREFSTSIYKFDNLLEWLTELQKTVDLLGYDGFIYFFFKVAR